MHSAVCSTDSVQWYSIDLWSIGGGELLYMHILLYVKLICCSTIPYTYAQLREGGGVSLP